MQSLFQAKQPVGKAHGQAYVTREREGETYAKPRIVIAKAEHPCNRFKIRWEVGLPTDVTLGSDYR